jgi:hypothetical protein
MTAYQITIVKKHVSLLGRQETQQLTRSHSSRNTTAYQSTVVKKHNSLSGRQETRQLTRSHSSRNTTAYQVALVNVRAEGSVSGQSVGAGATLVVRRLIDVVAVHTLFIN